MTELENFLFNIKLPQKEPCVGDLLVAEPFLRESYFNHAVVCLVDCPHAESSMGLVLNKLSDYSLADLLPVAGNSLSDIPVMSGGPVDENRLFYLHTLGDIMPGAEHIGNGLYIGGDFDSVVEYVNSGAAVKGLIKFYLGYSGWDALQLQDEIDRNVWAVAGAGCPDHVLGWAPEKFWHRQVRLMGPDYRGWLFHPQYPRLN
ncbi:YqgE/AlgH family protein [uncultured Muribaculum sp.]|uniref:YqgE/AlgH family protein n=1 Tax=uncultured Muribaculum sp. TaxID=1918613 RepID=UPI0025B7A202|nr:YqgE/AlgH family protein [uncultured Muribaculum sp.]